jgi:hypothetical protein
MNAHSDTLGSKITSCEIEPSHLRDILFDSENLVFRPVIRIGLHVFQYALCSLCLTGNPLICLTLPIVIGIVSVRPLATDL